MQRAIQRVVEALKEHGLTWDDPMGMPFDETRTDLEASIAGDSKENLAVIEVIKPIIRRRSADSLIASTRVVQPGVVIVQSISKDNTP